MATKHNRIGVVIMPGRKLAKVHFVSTVWLLACICYILLAELRKAGVQWWIVFPFSGYSVLLLLFFITLYLFAIFRGISSSQKLDIEHPLTRTPQYALFYVLAPFLGSLAGLLTITGKDTIGTFSLIMSLGTLATTFLVWVIADPLVGMLEVLNPTSRIHRLDRLAGEKTEREQKQLYNQQLLADIESKEKSERLKWQEILKPQAEKLAELLTSRNIDYRQAQRQAADIALQAWQTGGISCMRELRDMAISLSKERNSDTTDFIQYWWDGIGSWQSPSLGSHK